MSRLDSAIRRLSAQRACLDYAAAQIGERPGVVLELGLGNGRSFDHLRERLPAREIFVFEREVRAHPDCVPDAAHLFIGDLHATLPRAAERLARAAVLAHADLGSGRPEIDGALSRTVAAHLPALLCADALVLSDQPLADPCLRRQALPPGLATDRYYIYRCITSAEANERGRIEP